MATSNQEELRQMYAHGLEVDNPSDEASLFFEFSQGYEGCIGGLVVISAQLLRRLIAHLPVNEADVSVVLIDRHFCPYPGCALEV